MQYTLQQFQRPQIDTLVARLAEAPTRLILVSGPRQSGKTTLAKQALARIGMPSRYLAVDQLDSPGYESEFTEDSLRGRFVEHRAATRDHQWLVRVWEESRRRTRELARKSVLVLDEIQAIPQWSSAVKGLWDADRRENLPMHVVLLGSAPLVVQRGLAESLAGRFETIPLSHWSFAEMRGAFGFDLDEYLYFGGYPGAASLIRDEVRWRSYILNSIVDPHIERDLLAMERVDKPVLLRRLVDLGAEFSGQELSFTKMLGQLDDAGNTTTLARYLDLLEKSHILAGLQKYVGPTRRWRASSPKLNMLNTALMTSSSSYGYEDARADRTYWGRLVETAVGAHLVNTSVPPTRLYYWRDGDNEVDFVLVQGQRILLLEVKSGQRRHATRGIWKFEEKFGKAPCLRVGGDGIKLEEFLSASAQEWIDRA